MVTIQISQMLYSLLLLLSSIMTVDGFLYRHPPSSKLINMGRQKSLGNRGDLSMVSILPSLGSAAAVAGVIAFHEAGHLCAAKWQGMKVQSYNIGYGPKLLSFNDSTDTEFNLRVFPLGGYVAFPANVEVDDDGEITKELTDPNLLQNRPPLQRALVISGGVLANLLLTFLLSVGVAGTTGIGQPVYDSGILVTTATPKSPAVLAGVKINDIITKVCEPLEAKK